MQHVINKVDINKDADKKHLKQKASDWLNLWLDRIGQTLHTSHLSNYK
ncbi:hypothetical protein [uncultured Paraglaciecola sp.]